MNKLKVLDLFSGLGGFSLGLERTGYFETAAFCEIDKYCTLLLNKHWKGTKVYDDVRKITKEQFDEDGIPYPDIITGGFPCQSFSVAGKQKGTSDSRYLWPEMFRIIQVFQPRFVIGENVRGIVNIEDGVVFETVCANLESEGYEIQPFNIPAAGVGAPHRRERIWFIATNVANPIRNHEGRTISRGNGEEDRVQEEHRENHRSSRFFSRASEIRNADHGHETDVANADRGLRGGRRTIGSSGADREGELHLTQEAQTREHLRGETIGRSSVRGETKNVADTNDTGDRAPEHETNKDGQKTDERWQEQSQLKSSGHSKNVANANTGLCDGENHEVQSGGKTTNNGSSGRATADVANTEGSTRNVDETISRDGESKAQEIPRDGSSLRGESSWWDIEPNVGRVAHGVSGRVHRLKGLGNSIIPQIAEEIGKAFIKADRES